MLTGPQGSVKTATRKIHLKIHQDEKVKRVRDVLDASFNVDECSRGVAPLQVNPKTNRSFFHRPLRHGRTCVAGAIRRVLVVRITDVFVLKTFGTI